MRLGVGSLKNEHCGSQIMTEETPGRTLALRPGTSLIVNPAGMACTKQRAL
jgi:hypothetical protein